LANYYHHTSNIIGANKSNTNAINDIEWTEGDGRALFTFTSFTFNNAGAEGRTGPSLATALSNYDTATYTWLNDTAYFNIVDQGIQEFTVPTDANYTIEAIGAEGGQSANQSSTPGGGGNPARIIGTFALIGGDVLKIAVGQAGRGGQGWQRSDPGGGGGTFVWINDPPSDPLIIAGGGAGRRISQGSQANVDGQSGQNAGLAYGSGLANQTDTSMPGQVVAVGHGSYRQSNRYSCSGGGAGWLNEGNCSTRSNNGLSTPEKQNSASNCGGYGLFGRDLRLLSTRNDGNRMYDYTNLPVSQTQKLWGGWGSCATNNSNSHTGGFGGGGGGGCSGEGGAGGYTGGGATWAANDHGGGGGSYNGGSNQSNTAGYTGHSNVHGACIITKI